MMYICRRNTLWMIAALCSAIICLTGCNRPEKTAYAEFAAFGSDGWDPVCTLDFSPYPVDSVIARGEKFDIILTLRFSPRDLVKAIPLEITEEDEEGAIGTRHVTIPLCNADGKPRGKRGVALYEVYDTIRRGYTLPDGYLLSVSSLSPASNTECLRNLGITLERIK